LRELHSSLHRCFLIIDPTDRFFNPSHQYSI
jgi:hypothetical protein